MDDKYQITYIDIETAPIKGYTWGVWDTDVIEIEEDWFILSFSILRAGSKKPETYALPDFPLYSKDKHNDRELAEKLWEVLDSSDLLIAQNGDKFDIKKINARLIFHGMKPPSPFKTVDTLKVAKKYFAFTRNNLDFLCQFFGIGRKIKTDKSIWLGCYNGDEQSWAKMKKYNAQDVLLLEKLYTRFRPWIQTHPNINIKGNCEKLLCPACGSDKVQRRGFNHAKTYRAQRFVCLQPFCGRWSSGQREKIPGTVLA